jgi:hypothetical protein
MGSFIFWIFNHNSHTHYSSARPLPFTSTPHSPQRSFDPPFLGVFTQLKIKASIFRVYGRVRMKMEVPCPSAVSAAIYHTSRCQKTAVRTAIPGKRQPTHEAGNNTNATNVCRLVTRVPERVANSTLNIRTSSELSVTRLPP